MKIEVTNKGRTETHEVDNYSTYDYDSRSERIFRYTDKKGNYCVITEEIEHFSWGDCTTATLKRRCRHYHISNVKIIN